MENINSLCTSCMHIITNPLCPNCFKQEVLAWLSDKRISPMKIKMIKKQFNDFIRNESENLTDIECIICGKPAVTLCTYCFVEKSKEIVSENIENKKINNQFQKAFNTDIWVI